MSGPQFSAGGGIGFAGFLSEATFHPTPAGQRLYATVIADTFANLH